MKTYQRILLTFVLCLPATLVAAAPAQAAFGLWYIAPNAPSDLLQHRGCTFRVFWGNYGNAPFAKFIDYSRPKCAGLAIKSIYHDGIATRETAEVSAYWTSGSDSCGGSYSEKQATGRPGIATGMSIRFTSTYLVVISSRKDWSSVANITIKNC